MGIYPDTTVADGYTRGILATCTLWFHTFLCFLGLVGTIYIKIKCKPSAQYSQYSIILILPQATASDANKHSSLALSHMAGLEKLNYSHTLLPIYSSL